MEITANKFDYLLEEEKSPVGQNKFNYLLKENNMPEDDKNKFDYLLDAQKPHPQEQVQIKQQADEYGEIKTLTPLQETKDIANRFINVAGNALFGDIPFVRNTLPERIKSAKPVTNKEKIAYPLLKIVRDIALFETAGGATAKVAAKAAPVLNPIIKTLSKAAPKTTRAISTMTSEGIKGAAVGIATAESEKPEDVAEKALLYGTLTAGTTPVIAAVSAVGKGGAAILGKSKKLNEFGEWLGLRIKTTPVKELIKKRYGDIHSKLIDSEVFVSSLEKQLSEKEMKWLPYLVEKQIPDDIKKAIPKERLPKLVELSKDVRSYLDSAHEDLMKQYGKDVGFIENYVPHIWDIPKNKEKEVVNWFMTKNSHLKERVIPTIQEGIEKFGLKPKYEKITDIIKVYDQIRIKSAANLKFVNDLKNVKENGVPMIMRADKAPENWKTVDHPAVRRAMMIGKTKVNVPVKDTYSIIENTIEKIVEIERTLPRGSAKASSSGPIKKLEEVMVGALEARGMGTAEANAYLGRLRSAYAGAEVAEGVGSETVKESVKNKVKSIFKEIERKHPVDVPILSKIPVKVHPEIYEDVVSILNNYQPGKYTKVFDNINLIAKQMSLNLSLFHHTALSETGVATGIGKDVLKAWNPVKIIKSFKNGTYKEVINNNVLAKEAVMDGLELGAISDVEGGRTLVDILKRAEVSIKNKAAEKGIKTLIRKPLEFNNKFLWDYLHTTYKLTAYNKLKADMIKRFPEKQTKVVGEEVAQFVNDTFGGQAWELLAKSPQWKMFSRLILLSPDWTLSTMRQAVSPLGVGAVSKAGKEIREEMGKDFWRKALVYFGGSMNLLNYTYTKAFTGEGRYMWDNPPGKKTNLYIGQNPDGTEKYLRWGKQFRELAEAINNAPEVVGRKISPLIRIAKAQIFPDKVWQKEIVDNPFWSIKGAKARGIELGKGFMPYSLTQQSTDSGFSLLKFAMPTSKGATPYKIREGFVTALERGDKDLALEYWKAGYDNGIDSDKQFKLAVARMKSEDTYEKTKKARKIVNKVVVMDKDEAIEHLATLENELPPKVKKKIIEILNTRLTVAKKKEAFNKWLKEVK